MLVEERAEIGKGRIRSLGSLKIHRLIAAPDVADR